MSRSGVKVEIRAKHLDSLAVFLETVRDRAREMGRAYAGFVHALRRSHRAEPGFDDRAWARRCVGASRRSSRNQPIVSAAEVNPASCRRRRREHGRPRR